MKVRLSVLGTYLIMSSWMYRRYPPYSFGTSSLDIVAGFLVFKQLVCFRQKLAVHHGHRRECVDLGQGLASVYANSKEM